MLSAGGLLPSAETICLEMSESASTSTWFDPTQPPTTAPSEEAQAPRQVATSFASHIASIPVPEAEGEEVLGVDTSSEQAWASVAQADPIIASGREFWEVVNRKTPPNLEPHTPRKLVSSGLRKAQGAVDEPAADFNKEMEQAQR